MNIPLVDLVAQYHSIKDEIDPAIQQILESASFIGGKPVADFERAFASYCGAKAAVGAASGTAALHLALMETGIQPGEEVITVSQTFIATAEVVRMCGANVRMIDVDPRTYCMDPAGLRAVVNDRTRVIIPVHLYGHPADMNPILELASHRGITVIEDAAQSHGATYHGRRVGGLAPLGTFSFYPGKNLGAYGDAGAVTTADAGAADRIARLANHGRAEKYEHLIEGYNYRLDALQAAVLSVKLRHLEQWNARRREIAALYTRLLADVPEVTTPYVAPYAEHVFHLYVIQVPHRDAVAAALREQGVMVQLHYPIPLHLQPAYAHLGIKRGSLPATERIAERCISMPAYPEMTDAQTRSVVDCLKQALVRVPS
ncbi:MAG: DegT/DnrJ/EryC1/StrS family aminotransferase [Candidatus Eisenbacteria bacterium]